MRGCDKMKAKEKKKKQEERRCNCNTARYRIGWCNTNNSLPITTSSSTAVRDHHITSALIPCDCQDMKDHFQSSILELEDLGFDRFLSSERDGRLATLRPSLLVLHDCTSPPTALQPTSLSSHF